MIVISTDIVLASDEQEVNDCNPRIGWHNVVTPNNLFSDEGSTTLANLGNPATFLKWEADTASDQSVGVVLGAAQTVNYFGIAAHNLGTIGAQIQLESSNDGMAYSPVSDQFLVADDRAFIHEFEDAFAQYYRLAITDASAPPEIAVLYIGQMLRVQRRIYVGHSPFTLAPVTRVSSGKSESGQFLGRVVRSTTYETSLEVDNLTASWVRQRLEPFILAAADTPFFWSWRPCSYPTEVGFAWATGDPQLTNTRANGMMTLSLSMQGIR